jgi:hypothetical protein
MNSLVVGRIIDYNYKIPNNDWIADEKDLIDDSLNKKYFIKKFENKK